MRTPNFLNNLRMGCHLWRRVSLLLPYPYITMTIIHSICVLDYLSCARTYTFSVFNTQDVL